MNLVKIRLRKPRRVLTFLNHDLPIGRDDHCIVQTDRGLEYGDCVLPPEPCHPGMSKRMSMSVVRLATEKDEAKQGKIVEEEKHAREICLKKIRKRELSMKLVDAEYTFDKRKVVFYFTAEDRVDFRELVRDLAHELRTRIELRHIQVRDESKMVGGIGSCGRELCCTTWLNEFKPISMKMAKRQNLSLNPSKISGQCGRLMCCLSYENELYHQGKIAFETAKARVEEAASGADKWEPMPEVIFNRDAGGTVAERETPVEEDVELLVEVEADETPESAPAEKPEESKSEEASEPKRVRRRKRKRGGGKRRGGPK